MSKDTKTVVVVVFAVIMLFLLVRLNNELSSPDVVEIQIIEPGSR
jgi:hypothetical protein